MSRRFSPNAQPHRAPDRAFFYVLSGEVTVADHAVRAGQVAWADPVPRATGSVITLATRDADQPSVVMACSGQPIGQPVAMGGPFVMNTKGGDHAGVQRLLRRQVRRHSPPGAPEAPLTRGPAAGS